MTAVEEEYVTGVRPAWMTAAACRDTHPSVFYPFTSNPRESDAALDICLTCSVQPECLEYAIVNGEEDGIWGATTAKVRIELIKERRRLPT